MSVVLTLMAVLLRNVVQFLIYPSVSKSPWLVAEHLHFDIRLQFCFKADFNMT